LERFNFEIIYAGISGLLLWLSWPQDGIVWLKFLALAPLLALPEMYPSLSLRRFFLLSYETFLLWNLFTTWWVWNASPEGAVVAITINSFFMAIIFWLGLYVRRNLGIWKGALGLISLWLAYEYFHQRWDLAWPWLLLGFGFANMPEWIQWYEWTGPLGGSAWILGVNYAMARLFRPTEFLFILKRMATALLLIGIPVLLSYLLYFFKSDGHGYTLRISILQPNVDPWNEKFDVMPPKMQVERLLNMAAEVEADLYIAPETALPHIILEKQIKNDSLLGLLRNFIKSKDKSALITGLSTQDIFSSDESHAPYSATLIGPDLYLDDFNTAAFLSKNDSIILYHKSKLVPGPEMLPFPKLLKPLQDKLFGRLGGMIGNLGVQKEPTVFIHPKDSIGIAPAICYESVFPYFMARFIRAGADMVAVITNDGWWGDTPGYKQHFAYARVLAVCLGVPVVQSANTGISGFINAKGDVIKQTAYWEPAVLTSEIQVPFDPSPTFFVKFGDLLGRLGILIGMVLLLLAIRQSFLRNKIF